MYYLVGDIGNTSTRICLLNKKFKIIKSIIFDTKNIFTRGYVKKILKKTLKRNIKREILFSCVVPKAYRKIKKDFQELKFKTIDVKELNLKKLIKINLKNIKQLGSDRIVNSIEGKKFYQMSSKEACATKYCYF